ncbi:MAG: RES family NAD+ phosphorylase [Ferruginibacter sp.]
MIVYRLASSAYKDDLTGTGAKLYGGRWNSIGFPALYCTQNLSLAVLEILVRTGINILPPEYSVIKLDIPEKVTVQKILNSKLKPGWKTDIESTQWMGTEFLRNAKNAVLEIPSAIVDVEFNFLINPIHTDFKKIKLISAEKFEFDKRLFLRNE